MDIRFVDHKIKVWPGAIIEDGDRKSSDLCAPMIWNYFSIFRTNCAIMTSYIRGDPCKSREFCRLCCHVAWSDGESCEILSQIFHSDDREWGVEEEPGLFYLLLYSALIEKVSFAESKISLISRYEWIISARASCTRKLLLLLCTEKFCKKTLYWSLLWYGVNCEFPKTMRNHKQNLFLIVSYCFCLFGELAKAFERQYDV